MDSTIELNDFCRKHWKATLNFLPGNVVISVTGTGNGTITHGHAGICGKAGNIMSNDSATGLWQQNYSVVSWVKYYRGKGGMKVLVYEPI